MKVILIHGEDTLKARKRYGTIINGVKKKGWQIVHINVSSKTPLAEVLVSNSLFPEEVLYTFDKPSDLTEKDLEWLKTESDKLTGNLLLFCKGDALQKLVKSLPKDTKFEKFDVPKVLFQFLEAVYPGNTKRALSLLEDTLKTQPLELVLAMLGRHLRDLYWLKVDRNSMPGPEWKIGKLNKQAACFSSDGLKDLIASLAIADSESKTGGVTLAVSLDLILVSQLQ